MPVIKNKTKNKGSKKAPAKNKALKKPTKALVAKAPKNQKLPHSVAYYDCLTNEAKKNLKGVKITQICHHCKHNSQKLAVVKKQAREVEKLKIAQAWKQIGLSLSKLIE